MDFIAKKTLAIIGIILFIVGGVLPAFANDFNMILVYRGIFGVGIGLIQVVCSALVTENYEGSERDKVMGTMNSFQMFGCIVMSILGGYLGSLGWNTVFYVHSVAVISLIGAMVYLPYKKPLGKSATANVPQEKFQMTNACIGWIICMFIFFIGGQIFSNAVSFLITDLHLGSVAETGLVVSFFALGGFVMGFTFGKLSKVFKNATMAVGFLTLAISYLIMALSGNIILIYIGSFICGLAFSICMPCIMVGTANSVNAASAGMAIAIATCAQNLGQTISPYVVNPVSEPLAAGMGLNVSQMTIIVGAVLIGVLGIIFLIRGLAQNSKERKFEIGKGEII